ncbi:MAG: hypothetical protein QXD89_01655 [Candidatus Aenigmatarchaeota archaeon]
MDIRSQLEICYLNYKKWKEKAFNSFGLESKKALERAFFWLEIHSAIYAIGILETKVKTRQEKRMVLEAKKKVVEKLEEYEKIILEELNNENNI